MRRQARICVVLAVLCLVRAAGTTAACGASSSAAGQAGGPALHVTLVKPPNQTLLDKEVDDATAVRRLYDAALALPLVTPGVYNCPNGDDSVYHLTFSGVQGAV